MSPALHSINPSLSSLGFAQAVSVKRKEECLPSSQGVYRSDLDRSLKRIYPSFDPKDAVRKLLNIHRTRINWLDTRKEALRSECELTELQKRLDKECEGKGGFSRAAAVFTAVSGAGYPGLPALAIGTAAYFEGDIKYVAKSLPSSISLKQLARRQADLKSDCRELAEDFVQSGELKQTVPFRSKPADLIFYSMLRVMEDFVPQAGYAKDMAENLGRLKGVEMAAKMSLDDLSYSLSKVVNSSKWRRFEREKFITGCAIACFFHGATRPELTRAREFIGKLIEESESAVHYARLVLRRSDFDR